MLQVLQEIFSHENMTIVSGSTVDISVGRKQGIINGCLIKISKLNKLDVFFIEMEKYSGAYSYSKEEGEQFVKKEAILTILKKINKEVK